MSSNLKVWNSVKQTPNQFLKEIKFGYLKGKSDINPQWRLMAMTQAFGTVGHGWTYRIARTWSESAPDGTVMAFAEVAVKTKVDGEWGEEFFGIGGSTIVDKNKNGLQANDEGYKKAVTDALGVAFKAVGIAADIYLGNFDGSKYLYDYSEAYYEPKPLTDEQKEQLKVRFDVLTPENQEVIRKWVKDSLKVEGGLFALPQDMFNKALNAINAGISKQNEVTA